MLRIESIWTRIGATPVHRDVSVRVGHGEIVAILGSNGAGKTSLLRATMGLLPISAGEIAFDGVRLGSAKPHSRNRAGIGYVPEGRRIFGPMTVRENLEIGCYGAALSAADTAARVAEMYSRYPVLQQKADDPGGTLSGGQQQMLAIARALMSKPRLLLLDEPSLGLAPQMVRGVHDTIRSLKQDQEISVLLVEQNAGLALAVADRVYLMSGGEIVSEGTPEELEGSDDVLALYLGHGESESGDTTV